MTDRDYFAAYTQIDWDQAIEILRAADVNSPSVDEVVSARARIRFAEAGAMLALREAGPE